MPFAVWCHTCQPHAIIGQGVRFNAEKKKVGYYYSTPIWQFRMKHAACSGTVEIRTDPKETRYVVTEGGKARDYGDADKVREGEGGLPILTEEEREKRRTDAFAALEGKAEEKRVVEEGKKRIEELYRGRQRDWGDTWSANRRARESFRRERKIRKREDDKAEEIKNRIGTGIDLLPESEADDRRAKLVDFGGSQSVDAGSKTLFSDSKAGTTTTKTSKVLTQNRADALRKQLLNNTRAAVNPFNTSDGL
jgi:coiled-coil domain-containing protein 130